MRSFDDVDVGGPGKRRDGRDRAREEARSTSCRPRSSQPEQYRDQYRDRLREVVEQKVAGEEITIAEPERAAGAGDRPDGGAEGEPRAPSAAPAHEPTAARRGRAAPVAPQAADPDARAARSSDGSRRARRRRAPTSTRRRRPASWACPPAASGSACAPASSTRARRPRPAALRLRRPRPAADDARAPRRSACRCGRSAACSTRCGGRSATGRSRRLVVFADGERVVAWDGASRWQPESGQFLLQLRRRQVRASAPPRWRKLPAPRRRRGCRALTAEEWCDLAMEIEDRSPLEARAAYHHALDLDPGERDRAHQPRPPAPRRGEPRGAEAHYREALRHDPTSALAWYNLGVLLEDLARSRTRRCRATSAPCARTRSSPTPTTTCACSTSAPDAQRDAVRHLAIYPAAVAAQRADVARPELPRVLVGTSASAIRPGAAASTRRTRRPRTCSTSTPALGTVEINHTFYRLPTPALLDGVAARDAADVPLRAEGAAAHHAPAPAEGRGRVGARSARRRRRSATSSARCSSSCRRTCASTCVASTTSSPCCRRARARRSSSGSAGWLTDETYELLARHRAALCVADAEALTTPLVATAPFGYLRLRREDYTRGRARRLGRSASARSAAGSASTCTSSTTRPARRPRWRARASAHSLCHVVGAALGVRASRSRRPAPPARRAAACCRQRAARRRALVERERVVG